MRACFSISVIGIPILTKLIAFILVPIAVLFAAREIYRVLPTEPEELRENRRSSSVPQYVVDACG